MDATSSDAVHYLNLEYFFRLLYEGASNAQSFTLPSFSGVTAWALHTWDILTIDSFLFSIVALIVLVYSSIRYYQVHQLELANIYTLSVPEAEKEADHARWAHVQSLIESAHENDWRQAIIEADIMLDEALALRGYQGPNVGDRLKLVPQANLHSVRDAWDAHMVRNDIAHQGSAYKLDDKTAYRTIKKYENVFRELGEI